MNNIKLKTPSFNREKCKKGIAHIGLGNFHRAHQAFYINEYLNNYDDLNWGIIGINLRSNIVLKVSSSYLVSASSII